MLMLTENTRKCCDIGLMSLVEDFPRARNEIEILWTRYHRACGLVALFDFLALQFLQGGNAQSREIKGHSTDK
jgi:succinate dehydrogenase/fumarate reductase cytochrome b subunit